LTHRPVSWLWRCWLALGKLSILDGDPGLGKSLLALDLCARVTTGRPFPDGSPGCAPANVIVLNGEDGPEDTVRLRLQALGADLQRVFVMRPRQFDFDPLRFPAGASRLRDAVARLQAKLVVIDPIMAFLDGVATGCDQSIRSALLPLAELADEHGCAVQMVRHLNKTGMTHALYRGGGSIGIIGACRCAWLLGCDPAAPQRRILSQVKNNLAVLQTSLAFELRSRDNAPPELAWLGNSSWAADQVLGNRRSTPRQRAAAFLTAFLANGPRSARDIWSAACPQGLHERTLRRARRDLQARTTRVCVAGKHLTYWLLPGQELHAAVAPELPPDDLEHWLKPLREQFPPATPLEDC
jgi:hypothetical protein